jgi:putative component of membrane protein insertase Oxa1/YidC/SpoIIIJ protein YidD
MTLATRLLLAAIRGYKRHVSPHKGFACAYRVHEGCASCSSLGLRAVSRYGAWRGLGVLRLRLALCHLAAEEQRARRVAPRVAQAGFVDCDVPCDGSCTDACEIAACLDCGDCGDCGWGSPTGSRTRARGCGWGDAQAAESRQVRRRASRRRGDPVTDEPHDAPPPGQ